MRIKMPHFQQVALKYYPLLSPKENSTRRLVKYDFSATTFSAL